MPSQIDRAGTFTGTVLESTLGQSSSGYPQWVAKLAAQKKYVNTPEEMAHFQITEPGCVDWSSYDEYILAYLVLFTDKGPLKNYEQLMAATGWDGQDFQTLTDLVGKSILFRTEENTYKDKTSFQVNWIDAVDAPPERTLKSVDAMAAKALNARFLAGMKKPVAPPKPVAAASATPKPAPTAPTVSASATAATATPTESAKVMPPADAFDPPREKKAPPKKTKAPPPPVVDADATPAGLPSETTKEAAWEYLNEPAIMGTNDAQVVTDAWISACNEVGENRDETTFTTGEWAKVRDIVLKDLAIGK